MTAEADAGGSARVTHQSARERWGEPQEWEGSVNDPRTREEHGIRYNEKWIYLLREGQRRLVYWHRYGFRGMLLELADGSVQQESV